MKFFTAMLSCLMFVLGVSPAQATAINRNQANEYYNRCIASATAPGDSMSEVCACTAARMMTLLSAEELAVMPEKNPAGQAAMKKMLVDVYAPCTEVVAREMFDFECVSNKKLSGIEDFDTPMICTCAAEKTAAWYQGKAQKIMDEAFKKDPAVTIANPLGGLLQHPLVKSQNLNNLVVCSAPPALLDSPDATPDASPTETAPTPAEAP